jgi:NAD(P)-dependent dehydrogenase (short-subunit alcohol dehydrogenase family)
MSHSAFSPSNVAVVTGGASGIGLAAAERFVTMNLKVCKSSPSRNRTSKASITSCAN